MNGDAHPLRARRLLLLTQHEAIVLMRTDCHVCKSEGRARVLLRAGTREVIATLYQIENEWLHPDEVGLSEAAWQRLVLKAGDVIDVENAPTVESLADVRRRIYGGRLDARAFGEIITDIVAGRYADIHLATFVAACSAFPLDVEEVSPIDRPLMARPGEACPLSCWTTIGFGDGEGRRRGLGKDF